MGSRVRVQAVYGRRASERKKEREREIEREREREREREKESDKERVERERASEELRRVLVCACVLEK